MNWIYKLFKHKPKEVAAKGLDPKAAARAEVQEKLIQALHKGSVGHNLLKNGRTR